jgi:uncharacterized membrane protein|tara:strand:+ start:267 stop:692 length:426 start_codon:yes stop_codon:yes gene_type:complete
MYNYLFIFLVSLAYSIQFLISKIAVKYVDNINLIVQRYIVGSILLLIFVMIFRRESFINSVNSWSILYSFLIALCSIFGSGILYILLKSEALSKIIPTIEPIIVILTFLFGIFYFKEHFSVRLLGGVILSIVGVYLINTSK